MNKQRIKPTVFYNLGTLSKLKLSKLLVVRSKKKKKFYELKIFLRSLEKRTPVAVFYRNLSIVDIEHIVLILSYTDIVYLVSKRNF